MTTLRACGRHKQANLSARPEEKWVGTEEVWDHATDALRVALERAQLPYEIDEGGGAFYGPKIDVKVRDAIGRKWQLSTIQADFNMADRFDINYIGADKPTERQFRC